MANDHRRLIERLYVAFWNAGDDTATGRPVKYAGITTFRVRAGRFSEAWVADNTVQLVQSLREPDQKPAIA